MPRAYDKFGQIKEGGVTVSLQKPGEEPVVVDLDKGFNSEIKNTDSKSEKKPDER